MNRCFLPALAAMLLLTATLRADDVRKQLFKEEGKLTKDEPFDNVFKKSYQKVHSVKLQADQLVRIEVRSKEFNAYVRLESEAGKVLAKNDRGFNTNNSHFVFKVPAEGTYRLVVTSAQPDKTGDYALTVLEGILVDHRDGLSARAPTLKTMAPALRLEYLAELRGYLNLRGDKIDLEDAIVTQIACKTLEGVSYDFAAVTFAEFMDLLAKTQDKKAQAHMQIMETANRRLRLLGKNLTFKGTTVEGKDFDLESYRGKVVLIDFWATWCGPCRAEMPNVVKNYEKYKDKGFEVVGISLDANRAALEKFLEKESLPWICLHEKEAGNKNPTARMVGVAFIPTCILVDRNGKVISLQARGAYLGQLLEKHIGAR